MIHISSPGAAGGSPRVAQKRAVRIDAILDRAAALIADDGLDKLTLQRLGATMGIVPAALYRYFPSKDALTAALQRRAVGATHAALTAAHAAVAPALQRQPDEVAAVASLVATARFYLDLPRSHPEEWQLVATLLGDPRHLLSDEESRKTAPMLAALLMDVQAQVERATQAGALSRGDATLRTMVWWAALHGALALGKARRVATELPSPVEVGLEATRALAIAWGAPADLWKRAVRAAEGAQSRVESASSEVAQPPKTRAPEERGATTKHAARRVAKAATARRNDERSVR